MAKIEIRKVRIANIVYPFEVTIRTSREAFFSGGLQAFKIVGVVFLCLLPLAIMEPFLFLIWGTAVAGVLILIVGPILHLKYWSETQTFDYCDALCPNCNVPTRLKSYVSRRLTDEITLLCPECGQTCRGTVR